MDELGVDVTDDATTQQNVAGDDCGIDEFSQLNLTGTKTKETLDKSMLKVLELLAGISQLLIKAQESSESVPSNAERRVFAAAVQHILSLIVDEEVPPCQDNFAKAELLSGFPIPPPVPPPWDPNHWNNKDAGEHWLPLHWCAVLPSPAITNEDVCSILRSNENTGIDGKYGHRHSHRGTRVIRRNNGTHSLNTPSCIIAHIA